MKQVSRVVAKHYAFAPFSRACWAATLVLTLTREVNAVEPWLAFAGSPGCPGNQDELGARILESVAGARNPELAVEVDMVDVLHSTAAVVRLGLGSQSLGVKRLVTPLCEETLDAVVAVVALALSMEPTPLTPSATSGLSEMDGAAPEGTSSVEPPRQRPRHASRPDVPTDRADTSEASNQPALSADGWRLLMAAGVDVGTLDVPTPFLGAGVVLRMGRRTELRALAWYGLPSSREEVSETFESTRADFGAAALDYCVGVDGERWLTLCGGVEARMKRLSRIEEQPDQPRSTEEHVNSGLAAAVGAVFAYREAALAPQLELAARLPMLEAGPTEAQRLGFRAAFGAAIAF